VPPLGWRPVRHHTALSAAPSASRSAVSTEAPAKQSCSPQKLVYIGASENVRACVADHERQEAWESHIDTGEELCFSFAKVAAETLEHVAAALIFRHKPPENGTYRKSFPFDPTTLALSDQAGFLAKSFTV
jgi:hypothetical protein